MSKSDKLGRSNAMTAAQRERLEKMAESLGRSADLQKVIKWPNATAEMVLRVLTTNEQRSADSAALREAQAEFENRSTPRNEAAEALGIAKAKQVLVKACRNPDDGKPFFANPKELGDLATIGELHAVYQMYSDFVDEVDPDLESLSEEELEIIDEHIKKKAATALKNIASSLPKRSLLTLVDRLVNSLEVNSTST